MLKNHRYWIFDLDGTLTIAQHDFDALRAQLGLPEKRPILEAIAELPTKQAETLTRKLDQLELEIAAEAEPQPGATELLETLLSAKLRVGILTRNSHLNARTTLEACGMQNMFSDEDIISRNCAIPKPHPDGIHQLLKRWKGIARETVMVGDFLFDLQCGQRAGATTVYFDPLQQGLWIDNADIVITQLNELKTLSQTD